MKVKLIVKIFLLGLLVTMEGSSLCWAWTNRAHYLLAQKAFEALPEEHQRKLMPFFKELMEGSSKPLENSTKNHTSLNLYGYMKDMEEDIAILKKAAKKGPDAYWAYLMGYNAYKMADLNLPFYLPQGPREKRLREALQQDIDAYLPSLNYRKGQRQRIDNLRQYLAQNQRFLAEDSYFLGLDYASKKGLRGYGQRALPQYFQRTIDSMADLWFTILSSSQDARTRIEPKAAIRYLMGHWDYLEAHGQGGFFPDSLNIFWEDDGLDRTMEVVADGFTRANQYKRASHLYEEAMRLNPSRLSLKAKAQAAFFQYGEQLLREKDYSEAQRVYGKVLALNPEHKRALKRMEHLSEKAGKALSPSPGKEMDESQPLIPEWKEASWPLAFHSVKPLVKEVDGKNLSKVIDHFARRYGLDPPLIQAVIKAESNYDPYAVSSEGARGIMQLMPSTGMLMGVENLFDVRENIAGGTQYLSHMLSLFKGDLHLALAAYNAGPKNVEKYGGIPPFSETRVYVKRVMQFYQTYRGKGVGKIALKPSLKSTPPKTYLPKGNLKDKAPPFILLLKNGYTIRGDEVKREKGGIYLKMKFGWVMVEDSMVAKVF